MNTSLKEKLDCIFGTLVVKIINIEIIVHIIRMKIESQTWPRISDSFVRMKCPERLFMQFNPDESIQQFESRIE